MPRFTDIALNATKPIRKFNNYRPLPRYKIVLPPVLSDFVSNKGDKSKVAPCVQEMTVMFACWKKNDFIESKCSKEMEEFNQCMIAANALAQKKKAGETDQTVGSSDRPTSQTVNKLLRRHPQPPPTIKVKL